MTSSQTCSSRQNAGALDGVQVAATQGQPIFPSVTVRPSARIVERRSCFSPSSMHHAQLSSNNHTTYVHVNVAASVITAAYLLDELATRPDLSSTRYRDAGLCRLHVPLMVSWAPPRRRATYPWPACCVATALTMSRITTAPRRTMHASHVQMPRCSLHAHAP